MVQLRTFVMAALFLVVAVASLPSAQAACDPHKPNATGKLACAATDEPFYLAGHAVSTAICVVYENPPAQAPACLVTGNQDPLLAATVYFATCPLNEGILPCYV